MPNPEGKNELGAREFGQIAEYVGPKIRETFRSDLDGQTEEFRKMITAHERSMRALQERSDEAQLRHEEEDRRAFELIHQSLSEGSKLMTEMRMTISSSLASWSTIKTFLVLSYPIIGMMLWDIAKHFLKI